MIVREYGKDNQRIVLIIHNDMHQSWDANEQIKKWGEKYKILIASLDKQDTGASLAARIKEQYGNHMYTVCLFSDEDNIMNEIIGKEGLRWDKFIIESKACNPGRLVEASIA